MDEKELKKLIENHETEEVEFKPSLSQINEIVESVSAFANSSGGKTIVGISNSGKILGVEIGKDTVERIVNKIVGNIEPKVYPSISVREIEQKKIIVVETGKPADKSVLAFGRPFKRVGKSTVRMSGEEYERRILERKKVYWDSKICEGANLDDIDGEKIRWFLREAKKERGLDISEDVSIRDALLKLKLAQGGNITNAAVLLFGKKPQDFFFSAEVKCIRFKGRNVTEPMLDMKIISGNIIDQVSEIEKFIFDHIRLESWIEEGKIQRQEKWEYPPKAIREATVNAICHRDYASQSNAQVRIFDDRIEFWNPGSLPTGWTAETLKHEHESKPWNPLIAKQFFWIRYVEDVGSGTNKIISWCTGWGLPEPMFEFTGTRVVTILRKPLPKEELSRLGLNERQIKVVEYVEKSGSITNSEYQRINDVHRVTATNDLKDMTKKGIFIRIGKGKRNLKYALVLHK